MDTLDGLHALRISMLFIQVGIDLQPNERMVGMHGLLCGSLISTTMRQLRNRRHHDYCVPAVSRYSGVMCAPCLFDANGYRNTI
jgi:hypothetical protein